MAFTYLLTNNIGKIRLLIADTDENSYDFEDDEITAAISMSSDIYAASALLIRSLAANRSRLAVSVKRGTMSEDLTKLPTLLMDLAKHLDIQSDQQADASLLEAYVDEDSEFFGWKLQTLKGL